MEKHFVTFLSPGTFFSEETTQPIESWCVELAIERSKHIIERYNAKPFCFYFTTRARTDQDLDSKRVATSKKYYLGGRVMTIQEVEQEMPDERILMSNMRGNGWEKIIVNNNGWRVSQPFLEGDVLLEIGAVK